MAFQFTEAQRLAIESRGSSLLVSAAAGSGKTRVLTERLMAYVTDPEEPRDIDSFLVITYTRAAAAELRGRILSELAQRSAVEPLNKRLRRQQSLCYRAKIGTIHSFCADVIRENCQHLGLSPAFTVLEEPRAAQLRERVLDRLLESRYERMDAPFRALTDSVGAGRDDSRLAAVTLSLYGKLRSHPYPEDWSAEQRRAFLLEGVADAGETPWGRELLQSVGESVRYWAGAMESAAELCQYDEKIAKVYGPSFAATAQALTALASALERGWDAAKDCLSVPFPSISGLRGDYNRALAEELKAVRKGCSEAAKDWEKRLAGSSDRLLAELRAAGPAMDALLTLTEDFDRAYAAEKRRQSVLDFSDLEHFACRLLWDKATGAPTWIAVELQSRFTEIMVDEYQDVNAVQDMIFSALSRGGRNLFLVGDVKQSIYRFRLADPGIFLDKYRRYAPMEDGGAEAGGRLVLLRENFRSRKCILDAANHVFANTMSVSLGELDYDEAAALRYGADYDEAEDVPVELCLLDPAGHSDEESPGRLDAEARFVARRIRAMVEAGTPVREGGRSRACTWGDFAVLLRSPGSGGAAFHRALLHAGVPVADVQGGGFFTSLEVGVAVDMLSVIDNPHADVPLISVLRSPAFGFTPDELSLIRAADREGGYYAALRAAAEGGHEKSTAFLALLERLRSMAPDLGLSGLLWRVYEETGLYTLCLAMEDGETRRGRLAALAELAGRFEGSGRGGLSRFLAHLRRQAEQGIEPAAASGDAVHILSIHRSKGLEFPFVFLSDLGHRFNRADLNAAVLLHSELGLGPKCTDTARGIEYPSLARRAIENRLWRESLSEELRVLYVAMTRAKERLIMTATWKNAAANLDKLRPGLTSPIPPELLRAAASPLRWVASAALLPGAEGVIETRIIPAGEESEAAVPAPSPERDEAAEEAAYALLSERLSFVYPYAAAVELPSKLTATGLTGRYDDAERQSESESLLPEPPRPFRRAELGRERAPDAAERGTAAHALLQFMDLSKAADAEGVRAEIARLLAAGRLSEAQAEAVDTDMVLRFGRSPLCRRMLESGTLRREFRFTLLADMSDYYDVPPGEKALLQGVVDAWFVEDGAVVVADYKTDRVSAAEAPEHAARYAPQLRAYAKALERIVGLPVKACLLCFLRPGTVVSVKIS